MKATEIIRFLQELTNNNSREWFTENKVWYDQVRKYFIVNYINKSLICSV